MCVCESISNYCIHVKYHKSNLLWTYKLQNSNDISHRSSLSSWLVNFCGYTLCMKQEAIWPTYLEGWILLFSRSSLLLFILIFHSLAAIWLNSTRISVILIYNAGFYILLAMINSCRVFSISFLCMSQKMGVFQSIWSSFAKFQFEAHLHGFCISEVHFQGFYLRCTFAN